MIGRAVLALAVLAAAAPSVADERDDEIFGDVEPAAASRDDEIFGEAPPDEAPSNEEATFGDDGEGLGGGLLSSEELDRRLGNAGSELELGGLLYLRGQYTAYENQPEETGPFSSPNLFDLYLDARPSDDLRIFARGRLTHHFAGTAVSPLGGEEALRTNQAALDQLWLKFDVDDAIYVTAGRQPIKWGTGRFWNPTDFLNRTRRDPLAVFDERLGVGLVKVHLPLEASGWNLYAIADFEDASRAREVGSAFRVEKLIGDVELSASTAFKRNQADRVGADVSFPLWDFDVRGEVAAVHDDDTTHFEGELDDDDDLTSALAKIRVDEDWPERWYAQAVVGADIGIRYSDEDSLTLGAEYFHNGAGYDDPRFYPRLLQQNDGEPGVFTPLYLGRHYLGVYASALGPGRWNDTTLIASVLANLSDGSYLGRFDYRVRLLTYLDVNTFAAYHFGDHGELRLGYDGLLDAPAVELGAGLSLRF